MPLPCSTLAPGLRILMTTSAHPRDDRFGPEVIMLQLINYSLFMDFLDVIAYSMQNMISCIAE
jgi:hypothetical protein